MVKSHKIIFVEIIFSELLPLHYGEVSPKCKSRRNVYWVSSTGKNMDFEFCEEYLRSASNKILLWQCYDKYIHIQLSFEEWQKVTCKRRSKEKNWYKL